VNGVCRIFLCELGGNPNKMNSRNETIVHCVCAIDSVDMTYVQQQRRYDCLQMVLLWTGTTLHDGRVEKASLATKDEVPAALSFLREVLVQRMNMIGRSLSIIININNIYIYFT